MRILGIDWGRARTGLALSDALGVTCRPFDIVAERDEQRLLERILEHARKEGVELIVVGLPRPLAGGTNCQVERVLSFTRRLQDLSRIPVETWDERFTSRMAGKGRSSGRSRDAVAACYMLQNYLDAHTAREGNR